MNLDSGNNSLTKLTMTITSVSSTLFPCGSALGMASYQSAFQTRKENQKKIALPHSEQWCAYIS